MATAPVSFPLFTSPYAFTSPIPTQNDPNWSPYAPTQSHGDLHHSTFPFFPTPAYCPPSLPSAATYPYPPPASAYTPATGFFPTPAYGPPPVFPAPAYTGTYLHPPDPWSTPSTTSEPTFPTPTSSVVPAYDPSAFLPGHDSSSSPARNTSSGRPIHSLHHHHFPPTSDHPLVQAAPQPTAATAPNREHQLPQSYASASDPSVVTACAPVASEMGRYLAYDGEDPAFPTTGNRIKPDCAPAVLTDLAPQHKHLFLDQTSFDAIQGQFAKITSMLSQLAVSLGRTQKVTSVGAAASVVCGSSASTTNTAGSTTTRKSSSRVFSAPSMSPSAATGSAAPQMFGEMPTTASAPSFGFTPSSGSKATASTTVPATATSASTVPSTPAYVAPQVFGEMPKPISGQDRNSYLSEQNVDGMPQAYGLHNLNRRSVVRADGTEHSYYALPENYHVERVTSKHRSAVLDDKTEDASNESVDVFTIKPEKQPCEEQQECEQLLICLSKKLATEHASACVNIISDVHDFTPALQTYEIEQLDDKKASVIVQQPREPQWNALLIQGTRKEWDPGDHPSCSSTQMKATGYCSVKCISWLSIVLQYTGDQVEGLKPLFLTIPWDPGVRILQFQITCNSTRTIRHDEWLKFSSPTSYDCSGEASKSVSKAILSCERSTATTVQVTVEFGLMDEMLHNGSEFRDAQPAYISQENYPLVFASNPEQQPYEEAQQDSVSRPSENPLPEVISEFALTDNMDVSVPRYIKVKHGQCIPRVSEYMYTSDCTIGDVILKDYKWNMVLSEEEREVWDPGTLASLQSSKANLYYQVDTYGISTDLGFTFSEDTVAIGCYNMPTNTCFSAMRLVDLLLYYSQGHGAKNKQTVQWDPGLQISELATWQSQESSASYVWDPGTILPWYKSKLWLLFPEEKIMVGLILEQWSSWVNALHYCQNFQICNAVSSQLLLQSHSWYNTLKAAVACHVFKIELPISKTSHIWDPAKGSSNTEVCDLTSRCLVFYLHQITKWTSTSSSGITSSEYAYTMDFLINQWEFLYQQDVQKNYNAKDLLSSQNYLHILEMEILFITFLPP